MHKAYAVIVVGGMYSICVCKKCRDRERKRASMFNLCIAFVCWDEFEQAGEFQDAHGGGRWSVKGVGLGLVSGSPGCLRPLSLSATYPSLGKHPH